MRKDNHDLTGAGPYQFTPDSDLAVGESFALPFRGLEKGKYREYLPFDTLRVINESNERITAEVNGRYTTTIPPNSVVGWDEQGVTSVTVTNNGTSTVANGDLQIEVKSEPFDQDDQARQERAKPYLVRAADDLIPGGLPGGG
jgi:hypothetical protein